MSNEKCLPCPENSWSSRLGSNRCECLTNYYRENELDILSACHEIQEIGAHNLNIEFIADDKFNITLDRENLDLSKSIQTEFKCFQCAATASKSSQFRDECELNCFVTNIANDWIVVSNRAGAVQSKLKLLIRQRLNDRELIRSTVFIYLNQEKHSNLAAIGTVSPVTSKNGKAVSMILNDQKTSTKNIICDKLSKSDSHKLNVNYLKKNSHGQCLNISVNLAAELNSLFTRQDLINKIKTTHIFQTRVYAILANNDYQLLPLSSNYHLNTNLNNQNEIFVKLNPINSIDIKNFILNGSHYPILACNLNEADKLKIEFSFRNKFDTSASSSATNNGQINDWRLFDIYTIEVKLNEVCNFAKEPAADGLNNYPLDLLTLMSLSNNPNPLSLGANSGSMKNDNQNSLKFNVFLPVLLSFIFVLFFILTAVFIRRYRINGCVNKDRKYACEKHLSKFKLNNFLIQTKFSNKKLSTNILTFFSKKNSCRY
jgi:hypothetical protein